MKPIRVWLAVDMDGQALLFRERPKYDERSGEWHPLSPYGGYFSIDTLPEFQGQCLEVDVVLQKREHEKESFR